MRECKEYEITIEKLLRVVHNYTNPIRISVVMGDAWLTCDEAHRSGQFSAKGESSADIEGIDPRLHIECKVGYSYKTIYEFLDQAIRDSKDGEIPIVNCKMDRKPWLCVMLLDDFIEIWNGKDKKER